MPNKIKYSTSALPNTLRSGNVLIGMNDVEYGPTSSTGFWNGIDPPGGGYCIYNPASNGSNVNIYRPANDAELIKIINEISSNSFTTAAQVLAWGAAQTSVVIVNRNYEDIVTDGLVLNLDAGYTVSYPRTGTTCYDMSGNSNTGNLQNSVTFSSTNGGMFTFDGTDDYIDCGNNSSLNSIVSYTVSTWINFPNVSRNYGPIFCRHNRGTISSDIEIYGGNGGITLAHNRSNGGSFCYFYAAGPNNNVPALFSVTYAANIWKTYINGSLNETITIPSGGVLVDPLVSSGYVTDIGQFYDGPYFAQGSVYMQHVYNRALSATEIAQNFNAQKSRYGLI